MGSHRNDACRVSIPSNGEVTSEPIDLQHLGMQTMDDQSLGAELLHMFVEQARLSLREMKGTDRVKALAAAHRLKGAALAVGAFGVAQAAADIEGKPGDSGLLVLLEARVKEAEAFIASMCG